MEWWGWVASGLGAIVLISQGIKAVKDMLSPAIKMQQRLEAVEEHGKKDSKHFAEIEAKFELQEATNQAMMNGLVAMINHSIDGNGIEGLKKAREELLQRIIERR